MKKNLGIFTLASVLLMISMASYASAKDKVPVSKAFRIGVIRNNPDHGTDHFGLLADYMANRLKEFSVEGGRIVVEKDANGMVRQMRNREVEMVLETPFSIFKIEEKVAIRLTLAAFKKNTKEYRTLFFVRKDSSIRNLSDLREKTIVFQDPGSTSAYAIPKAELAKNGFTLSPREEKTAPKGAVRYVFAGEEENQAYWVIQKRTEAGAFNHDDWNELPEKVRNELRIIHETRPILRLIVALHPDLPQPFTSAIEEILLNMHKDAEGRKALKSASRISTIERLTDEDYLSLQYIKDLLRFIDS
ncbi:MAG: phosphate/phosphite/phosphonate ABC transporter substrate-binding protein [Thermodesulfobacteriota bacterium]